MTRRVLSIRMTVSCSLSCITLCVITDELSSHRTDNSIHACTLNLISICLLVVLTLYIQDHFISTQVISSLLRYYFSLILYYRSEVENSLKSSSGHNSIQQILSDLWQKFSRNPSVVYNSPISMSLGRNVRLKLEQYILPALASSEQNSPGSALIICNTKSRPGWKDELEDIQCVLQSQFRLKVQQ